MKKKIVYSFLIFLAVILQTSVLPALFRESVPGDVVLMFVLAAMVLDGFFGFLWWAIFAGIVYDLVSYVQVGTHALIFLLVVYFVSFFSRRFSVELKGVGIFLFLFFVVVATFFSKAIVALSIVLDSQNFHQYPNLLLGSFSALIIQTMLNIILFVVCLQGLKKIKTFFDIE